MGSKIAYALGFALSLGVILSTGVGLFLIQTRPMLMWNDWDLLGIRQFGNLECPKRLYPTSSADMCLSLSPPEYAPNLPGTPQEVVFITQVGNKPAGQAEISAGKQIEFLQWFQPDGDQPLRWCRKVSGVDLTALGGRMESPILIVVVTEIDFGERISKRVIGSCSIMLHDPFTVGPILLSLVEILMAGANLILAGLFWRWSFQSLPRPSRKLWKILLPQALLSLVVVWLLWAFIGPFDLETGALLFSSEPGVTLSDLRVDGWGILVAAFLLPAAFALLGKIIIQSISRSFREQRKA